MNKIDFLTELEKKLKGLPKSEIDSRISFYDEMIDDMVEDGKTEEQAIQEIGGVDGVVEEIAKDIPLSTLVKEKMKPKRRISGLEIALLIIGFPLWFPLVLTGIILLFVGLLLTWVFVLVAYAIELSFLVYGPASIVAFFMFLSQGDMYLIHLGMGLVSIGFAILMWYVCKYLTKITFLFNKKLLLGFKKALIKGKEEK